jgi:hypothetical protein
MEERGAEEVEIEAGGVGAVAAAEPAGAPRRPPPRGGDDMARPADFVNEPEDLNFVVASIPVTAKATFTSKLNMFYGTSVSMVVAAFLKALFRARISQNPSVLLVDLIFSTFVSQTISREWATMYNSLGATSMLRQFEITGARTPSDASSAWVSSSKMNSTAAHALGQCVMASASATSSLGKKAIADGTIFAPKAGESEYHKLTNEAAKLVSDTDKAALVHFKTHAATLMKAIEKLLESGSGSVEEVAAKVATLGIKKF